MDVDIRLEAVPSNPILRVGNQVLELLRIRSSSQTLHYAVSDNYCAEVKSFDQSAIQRACDEDDHLRGSAMCTVKASR
jgi:hypothetical protein